MTKGIESLDKYVLWSLNASAVANIAQCGGRFRKIPIYVGDHLPPHFETVPEHVDQFLSVVHENWDVGAFARHPTAMAAFALWRLNWIHPFVEGNGRTARAACYYLICLRVGSLLPGRKIVPERIRENREPYYQALKEADAHWANGHFNTDALATYLEGLLKDQLTEDDPS